MKHDPPALPVPQGARDSGRDGPRLAPVPAAGSPPPGDETRARAIARAVWTEVHWLMPAGRKVTITVDGDAIGVDFAPWLRLDHTENSGTDRERNRT